MADDKNISRSINFTLYPVPDPVQNSRGKVPDPTKCDTSFYSKDVCLCEVHESCAVKVSNCENGCTGETLNKLASFLGCYVKGNPTGEDNCGPKHLDPCIKSSGIDSNAMASCIKDKASYASVIVNAYEHSKKIQTYPYSTIGGKEQPQGQTPSQFKKSLCKGGVKEAC